MKNMLNIYVRCPGGHREPVVKYLSHNNHIAEFAVDIDKRMYELDRLPRSEKPVGYTKIGHMKQRKVVDVDVDIYYNARTKDIKYVGNQFDVAEYLFSQVY